MIFSKILYSKESIPGATKALIDSTTQASIDASVKSAVTAATKASAKSQASTLSGMAKGVFKIPAALWSTTKAGTGIVMLATAATAAGAAGAYTSWDGSFLPDFDSVKLVLESGFESVKKVLPNLTWGDQSSWGESVGVKDLPEAPSKDLPKDLPTEDNSKKPKEPVVVIDGKPGSGNGGAGGASGSVIVRGIRALAKNVVTLPVVIVTGALAGVGSAISSDPNGDLLRGSLAVTVAVATTAGLYLTGKALKGALSEISSGIGNLFRHGERTNRKVDAMGQKLETMETSLNGIHTDIHQINQQVSVVAQQLGNVDHNMWQAAQRLDHLSGAGQSLIEKVDSLNGEVMSINSTLTENIDRVETSLSAVADKVTTNLSTLSTMGEKLDRLTSIINDNIISMGERLDALSSTISNNITSSVTHTVAEAMTNTTGAIARAAANTASSSATNALETQTALNSLSVKVDRLSDKVNGMEAAVNSATSTANSAKSAVESAVGSTQAALDASTGALTQSTEALGKMAPLLENLPGILTELNDPATFAVAATAAVAAAVANVSPPAAAGSGTTYQDRGTSAGPGPATPPRGSSSSGGQQGMATEGGGVLGTRGYTPAASHSLFSMAAGGNPGADILRLNRFWTPSVPIANPAQQVRPVSAPVSTIPSSSRSRDQTSEISDLAVSAAKRTLDNVRKSAR